MGFSIFVASPIVTLTLDEQKELQELNQELPISIFLRHNKAKKPELMSNSSSAKDVLKCKSKT